MKPITDESVHVFDNGGETIDRYTFITPDGDIYGSSKNPFYPRGFGMFSGNILHDSQRFYKWETRKEYIQEARENPDWLGEEVEIESLPEDVQKFIKQVTRTPNPPQNQ